MPRLPPGTLYVNWIFLIMNFALNFNPPLPKIDKKDKLVKKRQLRYFGAFVVNNSSFIKEYDSFFDEYYFIFYTLRNFKLNNTKCLKYRTSKLVLSVVPRKSDLKMLLYYYFKVLFLP